MRTPTKLPRLFKNLSIRITFKLIVLLILINFYASAQPYYFVQSHNQSLHQLSSEVFSAGWVFITDTMNVQNDSFLDNYLSDFGLSSEDSFALSRNVTDSFSVLEVYNQYHQNLLVEGGVLSIHSKNGLVFAVHGKLIDSLELETSPTIPSQVALDTAFAIVNATVYEWEVDTLEPYPVPQLLIAHIPGTPLFRDNYILCYKILINAENPHSSSDIYVNAITGSLAFRVSNMHTCNDEEGI